MGVIRDCATKNQDDLGAGEQQCLFKFVAEPCIGQSPGRIADAAATEHYDVETAIWDNPLNENCKTLLGALEGNQAAEFLAHWLSRLTAE